MKKILIVKAGKTYPDVIREFGDFEDWILAGMNLDPLKAELLPAYKNVTLPDPDLFCGIVITGSHNDVTEHLPWVESLATWIGKLPNTTVPVLGICFGHQLLAWSLGGQVADHPGGKEMGTVEVELNDKGIDNPVLNVLPKHFKAHVNHSQTVNQLPRHAIRLAGNSFESTHAFSFGKNILGVQFHPEYTTEIMKAQIKTEYNKLKTFNLSPEKLLEKVEEFAYGNQLLLRFKMQCGIQL